MFMIKKYPGSKLLLCFFILTGFIHTSEIRCTCISSMLFSGSISVVKYFPITIGNSSKEVDRLNVSLKGLLIKGDYTGCRLIVDRIIQKTGDNSIDDSTLSESYYFIGVYYSLTRSVHEAIRYFNLCISLKDKNHEYDERYAKTLYNLGVLYNRLGDFKRLEDYSIRSLEVNKKNYSDASPFLISTYSSLIIAYIELQEYEKAINYSNIALTIANNNPGRVSPVILADLYNNLGVCYSRLADFSKAKIYLDKSESIYKKSHLEIGRAHV